MRIARRSGECAHASPRSELVYQAHRCLIQDCFACSFLAAISDFVRPLLEAKRAPPGFSRRPNGRRFRFRSATLREIENASAARRRPKQPGHAELVRYCGDRESDDLVELRNRVGFAASRTQRVVGSKTYDAAIHSSAVAIVVPPEQPSAVNLKFPSYRRESS